MIVTLELLGGLIVTGAVVATLGVLAASELGRMITRDDEQREVEATPAPVLSFRDAA